MRRPGWSGAWARRCHFRRIRAVRAAAIELVQKYGCGSKMNEATRNWTAGFSLWFYVPGFIHFGYHSHICSWAKGTEKPAVPWWFSFDPYPSDLDLDMSHELPATFCLPYFHWGIKDMPVCLAELLDSLECVRPVMRTQKTGSPKALRYRLDVATAFRPVPDLLPSSKALRH